MKELIMLIINLFSFMNFNMSHFFDDINNNCKDEVYQYDVTHIHASLGYTIKQSGKVEFTGKMNPHSFYGLPKLIMPTC